jgi:F-type H+-transporting ATPase subunit delta
MQGASRESLAVVRDRLTALGEGADVAALASVADGLLGVVRLLDREGNLRRTLGDPTVHRMAKENLLTSLLGDQLGADTQELLLQASLLRWSSPRDLVDALEVLGATAIFLVAEKSGELERVGDELFRFARVVAGEPLLRSTLTDRALDVERKRALLDGLLEGKVAAGTRQVVDALVLSPRGRTLEDGLAEYADLAADVRKRTLATVTTAVPLDDAQRQRLTASLTAQLGRQVQVQVDIDPKVVGGVLVRVGDEVIDGSTRHRLAQARRAVS